MSTTPSVPTSVSAVAPNPALAAPKPLTAIQTIEQELIGFIKQREQAVALGVKLRLGDEERPRQLFLPNIDD